MNSLVAGQFDGQSDHHTPKPFVRQAFRKYLECGIFAHGFARAGCDDCGHDYCPGAANVDKAALHIGAVAFIHRFGSSLNGHVHFHVCVVDGVFEAVAGHAQADDVTDATASPSSVIFHPASEIDETAVAQVQATLRFSLLRAFVGRSLLQSSHGYGGTGASCHGADRGSQRWSGCA